MIVLIRLIFITLLSFFPVWGKGESPKIKVVVTFSILEDFVRQVAGEDVEVISLVSRDMDPHVYQPTPKDVKKIAESDLVIINGLTFEKWVHKIIENSGYKGKIIVASESVTPRKFPEGQSAEGGMTDPHAWHNVKNAIMYIQVIKEALLDLLPENAQMIQQRAEKYTQSLRDLDLWVFKEFTKIPKENRTVMTTHDAFWYFGEAYGVHFVSPVGVSTDAEPSASYVAKLIREMKQDNIHAIFVENLSNGKLIQEMVHEAGVSLGGTLYADSLSLQPEAGTYIKMIKYNTNQLVKALS